MSHHLSVARPEFLALLKRISLHKRRAAFETATITEKGGIAALDIGSTTLMFYAKGSWPGEARFTATMVVAVKQYPPAGDPVTISCDEQSITIGALKVSASWFRATAGKAVLPDDSDWIQTLLAARDQAQLERTPHFRSRLAQAQLELNKRIGRAAYELAPLGITQSDIQALVQVRFLERGRAPDAG